MNLETDVEDLVSRCVAIAVCYFHFAKTWKDWVSIVEKIRAVSEELENLELSLDSIRPLIVEELGERFDLGTADRLALEIFDLFEFASPTGPAMSAQI